MAAEQVGCPGDSADRFLSQGVPSPPFPRTLPETTPAAQPTPPAARPPHARRTSTAAGALTDAARRCLATAAAPG